MSDPLVVGAELPPVVRRARPDHISVFSGYPLRHNVHTDEAFAQERGLPGVIMEGLQLYCYVHDMLLRAFGEMWFHGGKLELAFLKVVTVGDTLTTGARVRTVEVGGDETSVTCDVWCKNQQGDTVAAGMATGKLKVSAS